MRKANSTPFANVWSWLLAVTLALGLSAQASAQCVLICNDLVQISLDDDCEVEILPDMILEGGGCPNGDLIVQMKVGNIWIPAILTSAQINQTIQVRVRDLISGNTCWGFVHVEDKWPPAIDCENIFLSCAITDYSPDYLVNVLGIPEGEPIVVENCGSFTLTYFDQFFDLGCNGSINGITDLSAYVQRKWTATDASGNTATCIQFIYFERRHVDDVLFPPDVTVDCSDPVTDPSVTGAPYISDFGIDFPLYPNGTLCELNVVFSDQILVVCDGSYKIIRTWTVYDWCLPTDPIPPSTNPLYYIQLIKVLDETGPELSCPEDLTVSTNSQDCCASIYLPDVLITDNCSQIASLQAMIVTFDPDGGGQTGMYQINGSLTTFPGNNLWDRDTLGQFFNLTPCLHPGTHTVMYTVTDDCGNTSTCEFTLTVADDNPPVAVCDEFTQVSLGADGMIFVNAITFDDGSYDDCSNVYFKVRRMDSNGCQDNNNFFDQVKFCCEDIGDTITVILRVYDVPVPNGPIDLDFEEWHSNECMVQVFVEDKLKPTITCPAHVTVNCENFDPSLWPYGQAFATDNCCIDNITVTNNFNLFDTVCNRGTIVRTFRAFDCFGLSSQCTQRVVVTYEQDYFVRFPNDVIVTFCDSSGIYGQPTFFGEDCELLGVSFEDEIFEVVPDACFKIERTWHIINWCTYNPNLPLTYIPNPNPNPAVNHPSNLTGPTVSACGTPNPWAPTVIRINPTDPTPTNYCIFYDPNGNGYEYKQIIKIVDGQDPVIANCPASPVTFCDYTPNDPLLWNEMYWFDPVINSHDVCEGPADLCLTATDFCSGSNININYLLFLDLDGDGLMETVINSKNLPDANTVFFGNAGNPNFGGGTPRQFDERPVPFNQKWRFALQTTTNGVNKTACVRWNTIQSPNTYVVPQLPYGTHKIKWIVEDGCGNESICEYTFIVKDCKKPTVVCLNGLSVNIMPTQMITLWAIDFLQYTEDNCTPANLLKIAIRKAGQGTGFPVDGAGNPITSVTFTCDELGTQAVEIWSIDLAGNADFCVTYVIVQDNMGNCPPGGGGNTLVANVAGAAKVNFSDPFTGVQDVNMQLTGSPPSGLPPISTFQMSSTQGVYNFNGIPVAGSYMVTPLKDDNPLNGVTTYDLVLISRHILGLEPLTTPYKMIAADANKSGSVTTNDIVEIRKLILGIYQELPNNTSWRFVKRDFVFNDVNNPFSSLFPEYYDIQQLQMTGYNSADFHSIKVGDVNQTAFTNSLVSNDDRSAGTLFFDVQDRAVKAGEEVVVPFTTGKTIGYQFTMDFDGLEVVEVLPGAGMTAENFAVFNASGALTASVDVPAFVILEGSVAEPSGFTVKFRATRSGDLSRMLNISSRITRAEGYGEEVSGTKLDVALRFNGQHGQVIAGADFALLQNTPNPVAGTTSIAFNLPEAGEATLTITNAEGRTIRTLKGDFVKGFNSLTLQRAELEAGVLFYQLDTPSHSAVKKMIVVD